jgi:hypothetical protein
MPTSYCSIADAYGSEFGMARGARRAQENGTQLANETRLAKLNQPQTAQMGGSTQMGFQMGGPQQPGPIYECPFCKNCNQSNNAFQQRVIEQAIWPRPRWVPQGVETQGDPYATRYFTQQENNSRGGYQMGNPVGYPMVEHFTDTDAKPRENFSQQGGENILRLILWLLISLFAIQLVDLVLKLILV